MSHCTPNAQAKQAEDFKSWGLCAHSWWDRGGGEPRATWLECAANLPKHADTLAWVGLINRSLFGSSDAAEATRDHLKVFSSSSAAQLLSPWFDGLCSTALLCSQHHRSTTTREEKRRPRARPASEHGTYSSERGHTQSKRVRVLGDRRKPVFMADAAARLPPPPRGPCMQAARVPIAPRTTYINSHGRSSSQSPGSSTESWA